MGEVNIFTFTHIKLLLLQSLTWWRSKMPCSSICSNFYLYTEKAAETNHEINYQQINNKKKSLVWSLIRHPQALANPSTGAKHAPVEGRSQSRCVFTSRWSRFMWSRRRAVPWAPLRFPTPASDRWLTNRNATAAPRVDRRHLRAPKTPKKTTV